MPEEIDADAYVRGHTYLQGYIMVPSGTTDSIMHIINHSDLEGDIPKSWVNAFSGGVFIDSIISVI